ncbi:hypothetical protein [Streptomyces chartreusis]|uniref:hypothetical protein n=1 Tax=Streptomyces chartreusis TaxID=1969 RepID=UPI003D729033
MHHEFTTVADYFGYTLARRGLSVRTQNNWAQGGDVLVIDAQAANVVRIADEHGWTHGAPSEWPGGWVAVGPADEVGGAVKTSELLYRSPGPGEFEADAARVICTVLEHLRRSGHPLPPEKPGEVDEALALAHLALTDVGWAPQCWHDPDGWCEELRAGHAAYLEGKAVAVGADDAGTLSCVAELGHFDPTPYGDLRGALEALRHGGMSSWKRTPYGRVWVDDAK